MDILLLVLIPIGLALTYARQQIDLEELELGAHIALGVFLYPHGSTPLAAFLGLTVYLLRRRRTVGAARVLVWVGFGLNVPLWFLIGWTISVRWLGDITYVVLPWNLLVAAIFLVAIVLAALGRRS